jgi:hypothetical protein
MATSIKLPTRRVGQTEVSAIGYGAMGISSYYGSAPPDEERFKVMPVSTDKNRISESCKRFAQLFISCLMPFMRLAVQTGTLQMCTVTPRNS